MAKLGLVFWYVNRIVPDGSEAELSDDYWRLSQPALANAFTLIQQAQEFQLKSRIAEVSPFLLLTRDARDWPRKSDSQDTPFSAFRMADAADLVKIHDTVADTRLPSDFAEFYDQVRRQRNLIMHVGVKGQRINASELFTSVLRTYQFLFTGASWPRRRHQHINSDRLTALFSNDHAGDALLTEFEALVELLKPAALQRFFGFDKKARRYICPKCMEEAEHTRPALAQLRPNTPEATQIYCFVCEQTTPVIRKSCNEKDCKSNVLLADGSCLVCW